MSALSSRRRVWGTVAALVLAGCLWSAAAARGQEKKKEEPPAPAGKSYLFSYVIVGALVAGGVFAVCRPCNRRDKPDAQQYADDD